LPTRNVFCTGSIPTFVLVFVTTLIIIFFCCASFSFSSLLFPLHPLHITTRLHLFFLHYSLFLYTSVFAAMSDLSYTLSDTDNSDVEDSENTKTVPSWALASQLPRTTSNELEHHPQKVFPRVHPNAVDLSVLFPGNFRTSKRNAKYECKLKSVPCWDKDELTSTELEQYYNHVMDKRRRQIQVKIASDLKMSTSPCKNLSKNQHVHVK